MIWVSFCISGFFILAAALVQFQVVSRGGTVALRPASMDLLAKSFLDVLPPSRAPLFAFVIWSAVSIAVDVGGPLFAGRTDALNTWLQAALFVDYCVLAPALIASYLNLASVMGEMQAPLAVRSQGRRIALFVCFQLLICALALLSQYSTIITQTSLETATPPVLWADPMTGSLNWRGAAHAALRGLDAIMALGLICTVVTLCSQWGAIVGIETADEAAAKKIRQVRRLRNALSICVGLASLILWVHCLTIFMHREAVGSTPSAFGQFVKSGWVFWAMLWAIAVGASAGLFFKAKRSAKLPR